MRTSPQRTQLHINVYMCSKKKKILMSTYTLMSILRIILSLDMLWDLFGGDAMR